ncbi:MAG: hypothetical protein K8S00_06170 [Bacteroidales bacterium]|nr:hypothetical protein [Bacteroidales bacterium]
MKKVLLIISLLLFIGILSCNLDGPGIFLTISKTTDIEDSKLAVEAVRNILYKDGNIMYILHGTSVKKADIITSNPTWQSVDFPKPVSEAVFVPGSPNHLVYSSVVDSPGTGKTVYVGSFTNPGAATAITDNLENVDLIDIKFDGSVVYAIIYNQVSEKIEIYTINASAQTSTLVCSFASSFPATSVHLVDNSANKHFIFVFYDETKGFINRFITFGAWSTIKELDNDAFNNTDNAAKDSPIIGAYAYNSIIYLVTNEGILISSTNNLVSNFTQINNADSSEHLSIVLTPSGSTAAVYSIPMIIVEKSDSTNKLLIMGGLSGIYYYDINAVTIPLEFSSSDDFYSNLSSTHILDFYNSSGISDFSFFTATSDKWIWETSAEDASSIQLL